MGQGFADAGTETQFGRSKVIVSRYQPQRAVDDRTVLLITGRDGPKMERSLNFQVASTNSAMSVVKVKENSTYQR
jgi:hypothetical protein